MKNIFSFSILMIVGLVFSIPFWFEEESQARSFEFNRSKDHIQSEDLAINSDKSIEPENKDIRPESLPIAIDQLKKITGFYQIKGQARAQLQKAIDALVTAAKLKGVEEHQKLNEQTLEGDQYRAEDFNTHKEI